MPLTLVQKICVWALPVLFAIALHEVAHGWVASWFGDQTAKRLGRLSINPFRHIDPVGTVLVPILLLIMGGFVFGWAKPVPVDARNLRHPRRDMVWVAAAGPSANFLMALFWAGVMKSSLALMQSHPLQAVHLFVLMGQAGIVINLILGILNLLPLPPLDGGRILSCLLPGRLAYYYDRIEPFGFFILLGLLLLGALSVIIGPLFAWSYQQITSLFAIPMGW